MKILDFTKIFSNKAKKINHSFVMMRPNHDWRVIVYTFVFFTVAFFVFSFYFLALLKKDGLFKVEVIDQSKASSVNQTKMDQVLNEFSAKSKKVSNFPKSSFFTTDPSK